MPALVVWALIGLGAQLVDGGLGMGYGVFGSTSLLAAGLAPAVASASVHLAEIGTSLASGVSHWRFENVDWPVAVRIGLPGAVGAFIGATALSRLPGDAARPWTSAILLVLGAAIVLRFAGRRRRARTGGRPSTTFLVPLGLVAGTIDATGGGGWGPVATPALIASDRLTPAKAVGTVVTAEFAVSSAAAGGFLLSLADGVDWAVVGALLAGGVVAAPIAARLVQVLPSRYLGLAVGGLITAANARTVLLAAGVPETLRHISYAALALAWVAAFVYAVRTNRASRTTAATGEATA